MSAAAGRSRRCAQANDGTDYPLRYKVPPHGALDKVQFARDHDSFTQTEARALTGGAHGPPWKAKRVVRLPSGDMYQGGFNDAGQLQGLGIYYNADGRLAGGWQEATYVNNSAEGHGAFRWRRAGMGGTGAWAANKIQGGSGGCGWLGHRPFDFSGEYHNDAKADGAVVITFQPDDGGGGVERTMKGPWKGGKPGPFGAFADVDECLVGSGGGGGGGGGSSSSSSSGSSSSSNSSSSSRSSSSSSKCRGISGAGDVLPPMAFAVAPAVTVSLGGGGGGGGGGGDGVGGGSGLLCRVRAIEMVANGSEEELEVGLLGRLSKLERSTFQGTQKGTPKQRIAALEAEYCDN